MSHAKKFEDLRAAIEQTAFVRQKDGARIIASEQTGARAEWLFDFRALMLQPKWLNRYAEIFWEIYAPRYPFQVGGMESAGIPLVTAIVMKGVERGTPVNGFFIRKSRKREGLMKQIEGTLTDEPVILVDDLVNFGNTLTKQLGVLAETGKNVSDAFVLLAFRDKEAYAFAEKKGVRIKALFNLMDFGVPLLSPKATEIPKDSFEVVWRFQGEHPSFHIVVPKSAPVLNDSYLFFGSDDGVFRAINQKTGGVAWEFKVGDHPPGKGILSSPALYQNTVFFGAYDGAVYALDTDTGEKKWSYDDADWVGSSPAIAEDLGLIFIGLEFGLFRKRGGIAALELGTGTRAWEAKMGDLTHGSPLYVREEGLVIVGSNDGIVYAYEAASGELRWHYKTKGAVKASFVYDAKRRLVLFGSFDGSLYALRAKDGIPVFARATGGAIYSTPCIVENTVFVGSLDKRVYALDLDSWKDRWTYQTNGRIFASPAFFENSIWIGSNDGRLYELDARVGMLKSFFQATERIVNKIAFNRNISCLFVPTVANELYCLRKKSP